jgi:hypothetical protein
VNCDQVCLLLIAEKPLPDEAREHLASCPICSQLARDNSGIEDAKPDPRVEQQIIATITKDLKPVHVVLPLWCYLLSIMGATSLVAAMGIKILGIAGWAADTNFQQTYFVLCLITAVGISASTLVRVVFPGAMLLLSPLVVVFLATVPSAVGVLTYPLTSYPGFARAVAACLFIGLGHATVGAAVVLFVIRRAVFVAQPQAIAMIALIGGLTGMIVLFVFCPHRDLGHIALAHTTVPILAAVIGGCLGRAVRSVVDPKNWTGG